MTKEELDKLAENLKKANGLVQDVLNAVNNLPRGDAADDLYTAVEEVSDAIEWAQERLRVLALEAE